MWVWQFFSEMTSTSSLNVNRQCGHTHSALATLVFDFIWFDYFIAPFRENSMCGSRCPPAAPVERSSFFFSFSCLQGICMSRQSQILFLSDVGIFTVHVWCATQTRPRFNVPSERRGTTTWVVHKSTPAPCPGRESNPGRRRGSAKC